MWEIRISEGPLYCFLYNHRNIFYVFSLIRSTFTSVKFLMQ